MNEIDQLQIRASEQQDRAETQIYAEHPSKEEMSRIVDSNTELIRRLSDAEAGLDAMIAARQAELNRYAAQKELDRWESEHDDHYLQMVREQQEWIQKRVSFPTCAPRPKRTTASWRNCSSRPGGDFLAALWTSCGDGQVEWRPKMPSLP